MAYFQPRTRSGSLPSYVPPSSSNTSSSSFKVAVRLRPLLENERKHSNVHCVSVELEHKAVVITKPEQRKQAASHIEIDDFSGLVRADAQSSQDFFFDTVFGPSSTQDEVYEVCAKHIILSVLEGYNGSIIAYGQTGTGKSFTIEGGNGDVNRGLIPRSSEEIFSYIKNTASIKDRFLVRVSFLEIYNEKISDLLDQDRTNLRIREDGSGMYVENLSESIVKSTEEIKALIKRGTQLRTTAETRSNRESSRSHAIFTIIVEHAQTADNGGTIVTIGKLRLADLAGSERLDVESQTKRQQETKHINVSLHTFGKVVMALTTSSTAGHVPYRDSKLTKILQDSLGGNCKTTMITTISPLSSSYTESLNSLKFAKRAKHVKNTATINKDVSEKAMLSAYQQEIKKLREQLKNQSGEADELSKLEKEKQIAEQLKDQVLSELEKQKLLFDKAEKEKMDYQRQIEQLEEKLLHGGGRFTESSEFKKVLEDERKKIMDDTKQEYEQKLAELEREKERLQRDKEEIRKEKEIIQSQFKQEAHSTQVMSKKPNLPRPPLATRQTRPLPFISPSPTLQERLKHHNTSLLSGSQLPVRRPLRTTPLLSPTAVSSSAYVNEPNVKIALQDYYQTLADPYTGIPCQVLTSGHRIFSGSNAFTWFAKNMEGVTSIDEAARVGKALIDLGMITEMQGLDQFVPYETSFYQFNDYSPYPEANLSRPISAFSMMSIPNSPIFVQQSRAASLPTVNAHIGNGLDSSFSLSSSPSLTTLHLSSPVELMETFGLNTNNPTQLHTAAIYGDINAVRELCKSMDKDIQDDQGYTPLMYAALGNQPKCCNVLLKKLQANVDLKNFNNQTALMMAVLQDYAEVVKVLLKNQAQTQCVDGNGNNVFHIAAGSSNARCLKLLLRHSCTLENANERNKLHQTPLLVSVLSHQHDALLMLLKAKCDPGISDNEGQTPLHHAVQQNCKQCVQCLVSMIPNDVNLVDIHGRSSLHIAARDGLYEMIEMLLQSLKCDVNMKDSKGKTALQYALQEQNDRIVKLLHLNGAA